MARMILKKVVVVHMQPLGKESISTFKVLKAVLKEEKINAKFIERSLLKENDFNGIDLAIALGGDGTFLKAARLITGSTPLLGVNSDITGKEGFFMPANRLNLRKSIKRIISGRFKKIQLTRLEARIDGKKIKEAALNEFYIGSEKAYGTFRCAVIVNDIKEMQKNSGIVVGTPAGSHAWLKSCGGTVVPIDSSGFQYIVREPYTGRLVKGYSLLGGLLGKHDSISIISYKSNAVLIADSLGAGHKITKGSVVKISPSKQNLNMVYF